MSKGVKLPIDGYVIQISNPNKLLWTDAKITKLMYIKCLIELAPYLIPACNQRFLTTIRFPDGTNGEAFYQKNCPEPIPEFATTAVQGDHRYVVLDKLATLVWLGNLACLEFHPSLELIHSAALPIQWIIDLDPSVKEEPRIMDAALKVGGLLRTLGIESLPKTSGATGVQLIIKLQPGPTWEELKQFGRFIGQYLCEQHPELFTIERMKKDRGDRIYIDYMQHDIGRTIASAYTPRATPYASLSMPLYWDEVAMHPSPKDFTLLNASERLQRTGDLLAAFPTQQLQPIIHSFLQVQK
ncbi:non-homologous end-joining DNA ligase [Paenibacillus sp. 1001270B_150601_E10]|uniref:non-homologous end-joining DNA ligase n=1 Tax=Paenibacillus sp. 1001270B_150601_E10 TaxID=2787079 RepID=UPI00189C6FAE|nr:non-homologous end-joining DNA ligase [Paenibacillus sp. 1001270B_150601_E10]